MIGQQVPLWLFCIQFFELCLLFIFIFISYFAAHAINRNRLFHWNLRLLINIMGLSWFGLTMSRIISLIDQLLYPEAILSNYILILDWPHIIPEAGRTFSVALGLSAAIIMIFERIAASVLLDTYEFRQHTFLIFLGMLLTMPLTGLMAYLTLFQEHGYKVAMVGGLMGLCTFCIFVLVDRWNRKRLNMAIRYGQNYTLTQRFQLSENVRAAKIIYKTVMCCSLGSIIVVSLFASYRFMKTPTQIFLLRAVFNLYASCFTFGIVMLTVLKTHVWRLNFTRHMNSFWGRIWTRKRAQIAPEKMSPIVKVVVLRNTDGLQLAFDQKIEGQMYFKQLEELWT